MPLSRKQSHNISRSVKGGSGTFMSARAGIALARKLLKHIPVVGLGTLLFAPFLRVVVNHWLHDAIFSHGMLIPLISAYLIWQKRAELAGLRVEPWSPGLGLVVLGCILNVMGTLSGILLVSGMGLSAVLIGITGFLWGKEPARKLAAPLAFLVFMVPWPSYTMASLTWRLQSIASSMAASILSSFGIVIYQDGNLLVLPNYILEVKEACSGTRSFFGLMALGGVMGMQREGHWVSCILLIAAAPPMALMANLVRIVGTGVAARWFGSAAGEEALHTVWGILVFLLAVAGLFTTQRILRWVIKTFASAS